MAGFALTLEVNSSPASLQSVFYFLIRLALVSAGIPDPQLETKFR